MISDLTPKLRKLLSLLPYLPRSVKLAWAAAKNWSVAWAVLLILQGLLPVVTVYLTRSLVDSLVAAVRSGAAWQNVRPVLFFAGLMAILFLLTDLLRGITNWVRTAQSERVQDHIRNLIHEKSASIDLSFYESPEFYDHLHRACTEAGYRPQALLENIGNLIQGGITLTAMAAVLIRFGFWVPLVLVVSTLPVLVLVLHYNLLQHEWWVRTTAENRRCRYYDRLLTSRDSAAEMRLFGLGDHFRCSYQSLRRQLRNERLKLAKSEALAELGARSIALLITCGILAWMLRQVLLKAITLGDLALFYQAFNQGQQVMRSLLRDAGQVYSNILFLESLFEFLALENRMKEPAHPAPAPEVLKEGVRFRHVDFRYPGSGKLALNDFSLLIPAGRITAIVGANGAGKSTLVKLICRLYDPQSGRIELDGVPVREIPIGQLRRLVTVLFQDPVHYNATASENIGLGDLDGMKRADDIEAAARASGADEFIVRLPEGYDTFLGRQFMGGTELSIGQWQRLALARAFLRRAPVIVLDEPTSAMDSWAEAEWFDRFCALAAGRTAMIITHRFTTAMRADIIHVMQDGRIVESGSHEELLCRNGLYAQSWKKQTKRWNPSVQPSGSG